MQMREKNKKATFWDAAIQAAQNAVGCSGCRDLAWEEQGRLLGGSGILSAPEVMTGHTTDRERGERAFGVQEIAHGTAQRPEKARRCKSLLWV